MNDELTRLRGIEVGGERAFDVAPKHTTTVLRDDDGGNVRVLAAGPLVASVEALARDALADYLPGVGLIASGVDLSLDAPVRLGTSVVIDAELYAVHPPRVTFTADVTRRSGDTIVKVGSVTLTLRAVERSALGTPE